MRPSGMTIGSSMRRASNTSRYHSIARSGSSTARYGVSACKRAGVYSRTSSVGMEVTSGSGPSSATMRRRSSDANAGLGASGTAGSRSSSKGSVITAPFGVANAKGVARTHEERFGCVHGPVELLGDFGNRQPVEVAQRECGAMVRAEFTEHLAGAHAFEVFVDRIGHRFVARQRELAIAARFVAPVIDELVARDGHEPRDREVWHRLPFDRVDRGEE